MEEQRGDTLTKRALGSFAGERGCRNRLGVTEDAYLEPSEEPKCAPMRRSPPLLTADPCDNGVSASPSHMSPRVRFAGLELLSLSMTAIQHEGVPMEKERQLTQGMQRFVLVPSSTFDAQDSRAVNACIDGQSGHGCWPERKIA